MDINSFAISGNVTRDAEMKYLPSGMAVCNFSIAHTTKKDAPAAFFDCVMFGKGAEALGQYITKGKKVGLVGRLNQDRWEDQNGQKRSKVNLIVNELAFYSSPKQAGGGNDYV